MNRFSSTLILIAVVAAAPAAAITVKLASLAPDGSVWDLAIEEMGAEWAEATDGRVRLRSTPAASPATSPTWCARCASASSTPRP